MNKADSDYVAGYMEQAGYTRTEVIEEADFILLNSCVVRQSAESKVVNKIHSLRGLKRNNPGLTIALTGCLVDSKIDELKKRFPNVDLFFKPQEWEVLSEWAESKGLHCPESKGFFPSAQSSVSVYIPIIQGCDSFCSYCIVPYRRGRVKSRDMEEILDQALSAVQQGTKEVTLAGQNVDSYGHDLVPRLELADLLIRLNGIDGLSRIRFVTNHPKDMSLRLIRTIAELEKVCEYINLPVQAGDNDILKAMRRGYTVEQYKDLVEQIRSVIPDVAISTDIIVGFPGETGLQFKETMKLLHQIKFDKVHVATYSPRSGTMAARELVDDVAAEEKKRRLAAVEDQQKDIATEINARLLNRTVEVLVEGKNKDKWQGRTRKDKLTFFTSPDDLLGQIVKVKIDKTSPWSLQGKVAFKADTH